MTKIEELRETLAASTQGEWKVRNQRDHRACNCMVDCEKGYGVAQGYSSPSAHIKYKDLWAEAEGNTNFIALAHNLMPTLLEAADLIEKIGFMWDCDEPLNCQQDFAEQVNTLREKLK